MMSDFSGEQCCGRLIEGRVREAVPLDGHEDQPAARHQTSQTALHWRPGYRRV